MHIKTTLKDYTEACLKFAEDTKDWKKRDIYKIYVTKGNSSWDEIEIKNFKSGESGIEVLWAFKKDEEYIKKFAYIELADTMAMLLMKNPQATFTFKIEYED